MRRIILLCTFGLLAVGCVSEYQYGNAIEVRMSSAFAPEVMGIWRDKVEQAAEIWKTALGEHCINPFPMSGAEPALVIMLYPKEEWNLPGVLGHAPLPDLIEVEGPSESEEQLGFMVDIVAHEMGHILRLTHNQDPTSIMSPGRHLPLNKDDIQRARKTLGCE